MSDAYRHKLLNWFCSMGLLALVCSIALGLHWYRIVVIATAHGWGDTFPDYAGPLSEGFSAYPMFFPALAFWHLCDFVERPRKLGQGGGWFTSYRLFATLLVLAAPVAAVAASDGVWLTGSSGVFCTSSIGDLHGCDGPGTMDTPLVIIVAPLLAIACIGKAIGAAGSYMRGSDD